MENQSFLVAVAALTLLIVFLPSAKHAWLQKLDVFGILSNDKDSINVADKPTAGAKMAEIQKMTKRGASYYRVSDLQKSGLFTM